MKSLVPLLALAGLLFPGSAVAELVAPGVTEGKLAVAADGTPSVSWLDGRRVLVANRGGGAWSSAAIATVPDAEARIAGATPGAVLVESRRGSWIRLVVRSGNRWRALRVADAPKRALLGTSGLALTRAGRPAVAYAVHEADEQTSLHLAQLGADGKLRRTRVTKNGFPRSTRPPAALPVLWPNGTLRVVLTFTQRGANALLWRREGVRWWGRVLYSSFLGTAPGGETFFLAWTVQHVTGENRLVLSTRPPSRSTVIHQNALAAALVLGAGGPEIAANEPVGPLVAGRLLGAVTTELDGRVLGYAAADAGRQLLLARRDGLEWFAAPTPPAVRITQSPAGWRVEGATGGTVVVYGETADARSPVYEAPVAADGTFNFSLPVVPGGYYRLVYADAATGVPYALLLRP